MKNIDDVLVLITTKIGFFWVFLSLLFIINLLGSYIFLYDSYIFLNLCIPSIVADSIICIIDVAANRFDVVQPRLFDLFLFCFIL